MNTRVMTGASLLSLTLAGALAGCNAAPTESVGQAVLGGAPDTSDPAIAMVWFPQDQAFCTGWLVSPTVVATAAHCFVDQVTGLPVTAEGVYFGTGVPQQPVPDGNGGTHGAPPDPSLTRYGIAGAVSDNQWYSGAPYTVDHNDVALIQLQRPVLLVSPLAYAKTDADIRGNVGASCEAVGFGAHSDGTQQSKYAATSTLESLTTTSVVARYGSGIATNGDSGSPLICNGLVVGTSAGHDRMTMPQVEEYYSRIDQSAAFIEQTVTAWTNACLAQQQAAFNACRAAASNSYQSCLCSVQLTNGEYRSCGVGAPSTLQCRPTGTWPPL